MEGVQMTNHLVNANKMVSDTPRTDAVDAKCNELELKDAVFYAIFHFGKLERELNAANAIIRQQQLLDEENLRLQERIKRLEEAGDAMVSHAKALGMDGTGLVKRWNKAKEAKP
jgi:hypothetical protein